jgi:hypothetical protein
VVAAGRPYLLSSNNILQVSGDDPVALFRISNTNEWLDLCGIAYGSSTNGRYIMRRAADAEVPRYYPDSWPPTNGTTARGATTI